jgi:hypothetical protein
MVVIDTDTHSSHFQIIRGDFKPGSINHLVIAEHLSLRLIILSIISLLD